MHQHFPYEGSKFRSKGAVKDSQDRDSIIPLQFCSLFANYLKKRLLKFDQELSASWKKSYDLRNRLPTHWSYFISKISVKLFGSGSAGSGSDRCGSESCLQIYRFLLPHPLLQLQLCLFNFCLFSYKCGKRNEFVVVVIVVTYSV